MRNITDFINEHLNNVVAEATVNEGEIKSENDFRDAAKAKFEEVYGDELDEKEMRWLELSDGL